MTMRTLQVSNFDSNLKIRSNVKTHLKLLAPDVKRDLFAGVRALVAGGLSKVASFLQPRWYDYPSKVIIGFLHTRGVATLIKIHYRRIHLLSVIVIDRLLQKQHQSSNGCKLFEARPSFVTKEGYSRCHQLLAILPNQMLIWAIDQITTSPSGDVQTKTLRLWYSLDANGFSSSPVYAVRSPTAFVTKRATVH
jgi:hypothetical protein